MSLPNDVRKIVSINNQIKKLEFARKEIYTQYELIGQGAVDILNREHEAYLEKQMKKNSEDA
jgi:hypothetical protein